MKILRLVTPFFILLAMSGFAQSGKTSADSPISTRDVKMDQAKTSVARILSDNVEIYDKEKQSGGDPKDLKVTDDRIEFKIKKQITTIYFTDFLDENITSPGYRKAKIVMSLGKFEFITNGWVTSNLKRLGELRQNLICIQNQTKKKRYESQLVLFEPIAAKYREMKVKSPVSEEQRKFVVQANSSNEAKLFTKAIELYSKAMEVDQTAYPAGYSNLALLSAQIKDFDAAIYYMKKYLLLEPEASDARNAQDKIYEWELSLTK